MAFFRYCCSHLVLGLMQTSLLFFNLALENEREKGLSDNESRKKTKRGGKQKKEVCSEALT